MLSFQPNYLKIDILYIRGIESNLAHQTIVEAILVLAHGNGIMVVAEGVETPEEQAALEALGVDYSQGYLFSIPKPTID